jgi:hypothetical protein
VEDTLRDLGLIAISTDEIRLDQQSANCIVPCASAALLKALRGIAKVKNGQVAKWQMGGDAAIR